MQLTRRGRAVAGCGLALVAGALVLAEPTLLWAAAAVGALLVAVAGGFVRRFGAECDRLDVVAECEPVEPLVDEEATMHLAVERPEADLPLRVTLRLPAAAEARGALSVELDAHREATITAPVTWPIAGSYGLGPVRVAATDPRGLFVAATDAPLDATVRVRARQPETVHLGRGGARVATAFGEHRADRVGAGIVASKLQRYEPGAPIGRIDWKATARTDDVYVVEPEAETDRRTVLVLDHRASMGAGEGATTPLSYLRHAALSVVESARRMGDPLGCVTVGDRGVSAAEPPGVGPGQYDAVEELVRSLEPTRAGVAPGRSAGVASGSAPGAASGGAVGAASSPGSASAGEAAAADGPAPDGPATDGPAADEPASSTATAGAAATSADAASPGTDAVGESGVGDTDRRDTGDAADGRSGRVTTSHGTPAATTAAPVDPDPQFGIRAANRLADGDDAFSRRLRPFFADDPEYLHRVDDEPLVAAVRTYLQRVRGSLWTVIVTDDGRRAELREAVRVARRTNDRVLVLLAPRVLFEARDLADLAGSYDAYREFEEFRSRLAAMDRVEALELAPGDRVEAVLAGGERA